MLVLLATIAAAQPAATAPVQATPRPRVTVRIVRPASIRRSPQGELAVTVAHHRSQRTRATIETTPGKRVRADLVEFE